MPKFKVLCKVTFLSSVEVELDEDDEIDVDEDAAVLRAINLDIEDYAEDCRSLEVEAQECTLIKP